MMGRLYGREEMSRLVKWTFGIPLIFVIYLALSLVMPLSASSQRMVLVLNIISYSVLIMVTVVIVKFFLKFPFVKFIRANGPFSGRNLSIGFWSMLALGLGTTFLWKALRPEDFTYTLQGGWALDFILAYMVVVLAAFVEEVICRAYIAYFVKDEMETNPLKRLLYCLGSAILFTILHFQNPEVAGPQAIYAMLFYFVMGFSLMAVYLSTGGIEAVLGIHIANNLVNAIFFTYGDAALKTNAIFTQANNVGVWTVVQAVFCVTLSSLACMKFKSKG